MPSHLGASVISNSKKTFDLLEFQIGAFKDNKIFNRDTDSLYNGKFNGLLRNKKNSR